jgi:hypothetical protein
MAVVLPSFDRGTASTAPAWWSGAHADHFHSGRTARARGTGQSSARLASAQRQPDRGLRAAVSSRGRSPRAAALSPVARSLPLRSPHPTTPTAGCSCRTVGRRVSASVNSSAMRLRPPRSGLLDSTDPGQPPDAPSIRRGGAKRCREFEPPEASRPRAQNSLGVRRPQRTESTAVRRATSVYSCGPAPSLRPELRPEKNDVADHCMLRSWPDRTAGRAQADETLDQQKHGARALLGRPDGLLSPRTLYVCEFGETTGPVRSPERRDVRDTRRALPHTDESPARFVPRAGGARLRFLCGSHSGFVGRPPALRVRSRGSAVARRISSCWPVILDTRY